MTMITHADILLVPKLEIFYEQTYLQIDIIMMIPYHSVIGNMITIYELILDDILNYTKLCWITTNLETILEKSI